MKLEDIRFNDGTVYWCKENLVPCHVLTTHPSDGACLIVEFLDEDLDITSSIAFNEASNLEIYEHTLQ